MIERGRYKNIAIETYFYREHAHLSERYITKAKEYLSLYEAMLTPYPYRRFAIVENRMPIGYAMPTYTLLGKNIVPLPFIVTTSVGHELLHQWFGASVSHDPNQGNWAEGLTSYLADHHFAALKGQGPNYRKKILINWDAYVNDTTAIPLTQFQSRNNKAESVVGYGKTAMLFHQLRQRLGDKVFLEALRRFIKHYQYRSTGFITLSDLRLALLYAVEEKNVSIKTIRGGKQYSKTVRLGQAEKMIIIRWLFQSSLALRFFSLFVSQTSKE